MKKKAFLFVLMICIMVVVGCAKTVYNENKENSAEQGNMAGGTSYQEETQYSQDSYELDVNEKFMVNKEDCVSFEHLLSEENLSEEDRTELKRFEPIFDDNTKIHVWWRTYEEEGLMTFHSIPYAYGDAKPGFMSLHEYTLVDMTGDGKKELIMRMGDIGGCVLMICEEDGTYYLSYNSIRQMQYIFEDGLIMGSGGAATRGYYRIYFENGIFTEEEIAYHDMDYVYLGNNEYQNLFEGYIGGESVTVEEFAAWELENAVNEVSWYSVDMS